MSGAWSNSHGFADHIECMIDSYRRGIICSLVLNSSRYFLQLIDYSINGI